MFRSRDKVSSLYLLEQHCNTRVFFDLVNVKLSRSFHMICSSSNYDPHVVNGAFVSHGPMHRIVFSRCTIN